MLDAVIGREKVHLQWLSTGCCADCRLTKRNAWIRSTLLSSSTLQSTSTYAIDDFFFLYLYTVAFQSKVVLSNHVFVSFTYHILSCFHYNNNGNNYLDTYITGTNKRLQQHSLFLIMQFFHQSIYTTDQYKTGRAKQILALDYVQTFHILQIQCVKLREGTQFM